jgi:hypothetical protein
VQISHGAGRIFISTSYCIQVIQVTVNLVIPAESSHYFFCSRNFP